MRRSTILTVAALAAGMSLAGCSLSNNPQSSGTQNYGLAGAYEDQVARDMAQGVADAADVIALGAGSAGLQKSAQAGADVPAGSADIQWQAWAYDGGWWTRGGSVAATGLNGATVDLSGVDSVQFLDNAGGPVQSGDISRLGGASASRHALLSVHGPDGAYCDVTSSQALAGTLVKTATDTTLTLNGTAGYTINAESADKASFCNLAGSAVVAGVTFSKEAIGWSKPTGGTVTLESPFKKATITYNNDGTATVVITDKSDNAATTVQLQIDNK